VSTEHCGNQQDTCPAPGKSFPSRVTQFLIQNPTTKLHLLLDETWGRQEHPCQEGWQGQGSPSQSDSVGAIGVKGPPAPLPAPGDAGGSGSPGQCWDFRC